MLSTNGNPTNLIASFQCDVCKKKTEQHVRVIKVVNEIFTVRLKCLDCMGKQTIEMTPDEFYKLE